MRDLQIDTTTWVSSLTSSFSIPCVQRSSPKNNMFSFFCNTQQPINSSQNLMVYSSFFTLILNSCIEWHWDENWECLLDWFVYSGTFCGQELFCAPFGTAALSTKRLPYAMHVLYPQMWLLCWTQFCIQNLILIYILLWVSIWFLFCCKYFESVWWCLSYFKWSSGSFWWYLLI